MLGKIVVNFGHSQKRKKQRCLHNAGCGADIPVGITCAPSEQNLNIPQLISGFLFFQFDIPQVPYFMFLYRVFFLPTSFPSYVSPYSEK